MFMITKQGKEVNYSDILLYSVNMKDIIVIVNDEEQMKKFSRTGRGSDAPIAVLPYTNEELTNIIESMKQINNIATSDDGNIVVTYDDGTEVKFSSVNEKIINSNYAEQKKAKEEKVIGLWDNIPEEEKKARRQKTKKKITKGLAVSLAAIMIAGGLHTCGKNGKFSKPKKVTGDMLNPTDPRKTEESVSTRSNFTKEAENLYNETVEINPFILKYQQISNVTSESISLLKIQKHCAIIAL